MEGQHAEALTNTLAFEVSGVPAEDLDGAAIVPARVIGESQRQVGDDPCNERSDRRSPMARARSPALADFSYCPSIQKCSVR